MYQLYGPGRSGDQWGIGELLGQEAFPRGAWKKPKVSVRT